MLNRKHNLKSGGKHNDKEKGSERQNRAENQRQKGLMKTTL